MRFWLTTESTSEESHFSYEPEWPAADVIIGNPPFLGGNKMRAELGDEYVDELFKLYDETCYHANAI